MESMPPMVRILPMDKSLEFSGQTINEVQEEFFKASLPYREDEYGEGKFRFKNRGMKAIANSIVLFQYDAKIVALARLTLIRRFDSPNLILKEESLQGLRNANCPVFKDLEELIDKLYEDEKDLFNDLVGILGEEKAFLYKSEVMKHAVKYVGAYYFKPESIRVFTPIESHEIREVWGDDFIDQDGKRRSGFKNFGRAKWYLDPKKYKHFYNSFIFDRI